MIDDKTLAEIKKNHPGELHLLEHQGYEVVVRSPPPTEWKRFRSLISDEAQRSGALETLCRACIVYPEGQELTDLFIAKPGLNETFGNELTELAGLAKGATRKKL